MERRRYFYRNKYGGCNTSIYDILYGNRNGFRLYGDCCINGNRNAIANGNGELTDHLQRPDRCIDSIRSK